MSKGGIFKFFSPGLLLVVAIFGAAQKPAAVQANSPSTISFQGRVLTKDRTQAPTGSYPFRFSLYSAQVGGAAAWQESWLGDGLSVRYGLFNVELGTYSSLSSLDWGNSSYWLGIEFDSDQNGTFDQAFSGRVPLTAAPYALSAQTISSTLPINKGGTGATTVSSALNNLLPSQSDNSGKVLVTDGSNTSWQNLSGGITDASYLTLGASSGLSNERSLQGTANQIYLTDGGANGAVTLYLPQDIGTSSNLQFRSLALSGTGSGSDLVLGGDTNLYRSVANVLKTDDRFHAVSGLMAGDSITIETDRLAFFYEYVNSSANYYGLVSQVINSGTGNSIGVLGSSYIVNVDAGGDGVGVQGQVIGSSNDGSSITNAKSFFSKNVMGSVPVTNSYGVYADNSTGSAITNNYGLFVADQTIGTSTDFGLVIAGADTQALWISSGADNTDAANGIAFGASRDTNLYRSAANTLITDDAFTAVAGIRQTSSNPDPYQWTGAISTTDLNGIIGINLQPAISSNRDAAGLTISFSSKPSIAAGVTVAGSYMHSRFYDTTLGAGASLANQYGLYIESLTSANSNYAIYLAGTGIGNGITLGGDANLYHGAANELRTDDLLSFSSTKTNTTTDFKTYKSDGGGAFIFDTSSTYTTGSLFSIRNNTSPKLSLSATGDLTIAGTLTQSGIPADIAENIAVSDGSIGAGDIVAADEQRNSTARKATASDQRVLGVISTQPGVLISGGTTGRPLTLAGRIPVKVKADAGIKRGDLIVISDQAGRGTKAGDTAAASVGTALTNQSGSTVVVQLQPGYYLPNFGSTTTANALSPQQSGVLGAINLLSDGTLSVASLEVARLTVTADLTVKGNLHVSGTANLGGVALPNKESATGVIPASETAYFVTTTSVTATDRVLITPVNEAGIPITTNISRGQIIPGQGFWVHLNATTTESVKFDWLLIH